MLPLGSPSKMLVGIGTDGLGTEAVGTLGGFGPAGLLELYLSCPLFLGMLETPLQHSRFA